MSDYYGEQTKLALANFPFSMPTVHLEFIYALAQIKKAAALANCNSKDLDAERARAIVAACEELLSGKFDDQFPLPFFQGGAGTSINMNINEILANRASELLHVQKQSVSVHPNDHVNMKQSTNDVNPSALKLASLQLSSRLLKAIDGVVAALNIKQEEFKHIPKLGRTHLQDAVPTRLGEEFASYAATISRDKRRLQSSFEYLSELNLGGTAIGNCINANQAYLDGVYPELNSITGLNFKPSANLMSLTSSQTDFCHVSQALVSLTLDASKIASDLRLLASGPNGGLGELRLKELQPGSSIMPGKVNPVLPEAVNQLYFLVSGNNLTIERAAEASQLELGVMLPVIIQCLLDSIILTTEVLEQFTSKCLLLLEADEARCRHNLETSTAYATLLTSKFGYDLVSQLVKESVSGHVPIRKLFLDKGLLTDAEFDAIVNNYGGD